jgi:hypothetical protein
MTDFIPKVIESNHYHLWTDVLHSRKLAKQARNKWDRASYVRWSIMTSWIVLEIACQDALNDSNISYSFRRNLDDAIQNNNHPALNWGNGIWQKVSNLQEKRKRIIHRFQTENNLFPEITDADEAINIVRESIKEIYRHTNNNYPLWIDDDDDRGWDDRGPRGSSTATVLHGGAKEDDLTSIKVYFVVNGKEKLSEVLPANTDYNQAVDNILYKSTVPISKVFVKQNDQIIFNKDLNMRGT